MILINKCNDYITNINNRCNPRLTPQEINERDDLIKNLKDSEKRLNERINHLTVKINSLQQTSKEEKNALNQQIEDLEDAKLIDERELQKKIDKLNRRISSLSNKSERDKRKLTQESSSLQSKLTETIKEKNKKIVSIQKLNGTIDDLRDEIKSLKNTSQQEKDDLLKQLSNLQSTREISEEEFKRQISDLKQQVENLTESSHKEKNSLNSKIADLELKLTVAAEAGKGYQKAITELEEKLKTAAGNLAVMTNSLQEAGGEKANLLDEVKRLQQSNLTAERLSQRETNKLQEKIGELSKISSEERKKLEEQVLSLKTELEEKVRAEQGYQTRIGELEDNLLSLTDKLKTTDRGQTKERSAVDNLEKEIKVKEQNLENLHSELVTLQSRLDVANNTINQQNQRIGQKNQYLTKLQKQLEEKDKLIEELRNRPLPVDISKSDANEEKASAADSHSVGELLKIIAEHQQEIQRLKTSIVKKTQEAEKEVETETVQQMSIKETIQQLPKKNNGALWLCLLGYSLGMITLCLNLWKKIRGKGRKTN